TSARPSSRSLRAWTSVSRARSTSTVTAAAQHATATTTATAASRAPRGLRGAEVRAGGCVRGSDLHRPQRTPHTGDGDAGGAEHLVVPHAARVDDDRVLE